MERRALLATDDGTLTTMGLSVNPAHENLSQHRGSKA